MSIGYVAIEGPIGVGKTTLADRLATDLGAERLVEAPEENPFLGDFYDNPSGHALSAQLFFLLQRARQIDSLRQADLFQRAGCIADFMFDKDPLFARLTLDGHEWALYDEIYTRLSWQAPQPDCVIFMSAPLDILMARIAQRARPAEHGLTRDYLARVVDGYDALFSRRHDCPVIRVDAQALDLVHDAQDYARVRDAVATPTGDRYFGPSAPH